MLNEPTHEKLITMKLFGMAAGFKERLSRIDHQDLNPSELVGLLVDDEYLHRCVFWPLVITHSDSS